MASIYTFAPAYKHLFPEHPESPGRLEVLDLDSIPGIQAWPFEAATAQEIERVHTPRMRARLEDACRYAPQIIDMAPTYVTGNSYYDALLAAGACLAATRAVVKGQARNAFAIVRPPGHHAEPEHAMGFCLFNNIAIAAVDALASGVERVMVVDYDAHHGNGTEKAFRDNPRAAYFSTHQENIYPGSGRLEDYPQAKGRLANFPLPPRSGDACFAQIFDQAVRPLAESFRPGLLLVSAGFDAHWSDPLTSLGLSSRGFFDISKKLAGLSEELCGGKIVFVLEGGYVPENVSSGVRAVFAAMTGLQPPRFANIVPMPLREQIVADLSKYPEPDISRRLEAFRNWHAL